MRNFNPSKIRNNSMGDSDDEDFDSGAEPEFAVQLVEFDEEIYRTPSDASDLEDDYVPPIFNDSSSDSDNDSSDSDGKVVIVDTKDTDDTTKTREKRAIDDYDEDEEEDEVVKAIIAEIKKPRSKPPDIKTEDFVVDICFHPENDIISFGTTAGDIFIYKYTNEENTLADTYEVHSKAIRDIEFSLDGKSLISTARDRTIMVTDVESGKLKRFWDDAHDEPVYTMSVIDENMFATGDDDGMLKLWDMRQRDPNPIFYLKEVEDFISSIITNDARKFLLMTSGDGHLTTINIPQKKLFVQSEPYEEELTCMGIFRKDSKLVAGSSKGNFYTFDWGQFGYHCDAFAGPQTGINVMIPITERIAVTGGEEGILRAMHMVPGRVLGVVGQHSLAVETMDICNSGEIIASSSHDNDIRFWNIKYFEDFDDIKYNSKPDKKALKHNLPSSQYANTSDFFADLAEAE